MFISNAGAGDGPYSMQVTESQTQQQTRPTTKLRSQRPRLIPELRVQDPDQHQDCDNKFLRRHEANTQVSRTRKSDRGTLN